MSERSILIAALSGRALAAAARRAGLTPLVVDAFGDLDTRASAGAYQEMSEVTRRGFRARPLIAALDALAGRSKRAPVGLVLGSGFEDTPRLVETLAQRFALLGNSGAAIAQAKAPGVFFPLLDRLAIAHPDTRLTPPADPHGWLSKRIGGSGGAHIVPYHPSGPQARLNPNRYFQRCLEGTPVSLLALASRNGVRVVGFSRQWSVGYGPRPYRYGGAAGPAELDPVLDERLSTAAEAVCAALGLVGLVAFDFLLQGTTPLMLEVNPRPSATLEIFDDAVGSLLTAHIAACQGREAPLPAPSAQARAAGILYADELPAGAVALTIGDVSWPAWTADRPAPCTRIPLGRPIATVLATGESATTAEYNCRRRLDELARMLYGRAADTEHDNAKIHRPRPERIGESGQAR